MAQVDLFIAGRTYQIACRDGEEQSLQAAARLVDTKSREALSGLGTLSETRQLLFAALLLADQIIDGGGMATAPVPDLDVADRVAALADRLEQIAESLEKEDAQA